MENKTLTLLPKNQLPEKAKHEIQIAEQIGKLKEGDLFYYSKEFGLIKIYEPNIINGEIKINPLIIKRNKTFNISVINPDNLTGWNEQFLRYMQLLAYAFESIPNKDLSYAYISTDDLPGYKIIPNNINSVDMEGDLIYTKEYGVLFVQVLDIHESNYIKIDDLWRWK